MGRSAIFVSVLLCSVLLWGSPAWAWSEKTHQQMATDALSSVKWLDQYQSLRVTPFPEMVKDVFGRADPVGPDGFEFFGKKTRQRKLAQYMTSTADMADRDVQRLARHLLLSNQTSIQYGLDEKAAPVSARQVLSHYAAEPDSGLDKGLDASWVQGIMGGVDPKMTSSQGFRHMSFLFGLMGQAPRRAQLCFDMGRRAIEKGHPYWGFRFTAWGLHYLEDMGTPVHTNMLPTLGYVRVKGMLRPKDPVTGKRRFNRGVIKDLVKGSAQINANYHFLYEAYVDKAYTGKGSDAQALRKAAAGNGKPAGLLGRMLAPRTIKGVARRRAWSRLSTPRIARNAVRFFTGKFRAPAEGAGTNTVAPVTKASVQRAIITSDQPLPGEGIRTYDRRMDARRTMMTSTTRQFKKNGVALRRAITILGRQLSKR